MKSAFLISLLTACNWNAPKSASSSRLQELKDKVEVNKVFYSAVADRATGWPSVTDCDGTLWAGIAVAGGMSADLSLAEYSPGEIHRRPAPGCWDPINGDMGSKSTVSNDMLLGYMLGAWAAKDLGALQRLGNYGEKNAWVMGRPVELVSRVVMKPNQVGLLGRAIYKLSGKKDNREYRYTPATYAKVYEDYERHLQAIGIYLQGETTDKEGVDLLDINDQMLDRLYELVVSEPENPLYHAVYGTYTGDMDKAIDLLMNDEVLWPSYMRGENIPALHKAEWLFAASIVLKRTTEKARNIKL